MTTITVYMPSGLVSVQSHPNVVPKHLRLMANGFMNMVPIGQFAVTISNVPDKPTGLSKSKVVKIFMPTPVAIMKVNPEKQPLVCEHPATGKNDFNIGRTSEPYIVQFVELLKDFAGI